MSIQLTPTRVFAAAWLLALLLAAAMAVAGAIQPPEDIAGAARREAQRISAVAGGTVIATAQAMDDRLRLPQCGSPLQARPAPGARGVNRLTVEVSCAGPQWRVFVPVSLEATLPVVVATRPLAARTVLVPADLQVASRDLSGLPQGYFQRVDELGGRELLRPLATGEAVAPAALRLAPTVRRGQHVTLVAHVRGLTVRMQGQALADGGLTQRIRVRNLSSGRDVEGTVRSPDVVEVAM